MSGAGAGDGIGSHCLPPELPAAEAADPRQQWSEALRGVATAQPDAAAAAPVAVALNLPGALDMALLPPGLRPASVSDVAGVEGAGLGPADPMPLPLPLPGGMAPVTPSIATQDVGPASLGSPLAASAAVPQGLAAVLRAAGYGGGLAAAGDEAAPVVAPPQGAAVAADDAVPVPVGGAVPRIENQLVAPRLDPQGGGRLTQPLPTTAGGMPRPPAAPGGGQSPTPGGSQSPTPSGNPRVGQPNAVALQAPAAANMPVAAVAASTPVAAVTTSTPVAAITASTHSGNGVAQGLGAQHASLSGLFAASAMIGAAGVWPVAGGVVQPRGTGGAAGRDGRVMSYTERRSVPIDIAPAAPVVPAWRLDDTQALVTVGPAGPRAAALRAAELYRDLLDREATLDALRPGEGFVTWEGSPLWLSLAAIRKPVALGVLAGYAPGRVQVMRTDDGAWLVEHAGGLWRAPRCLRHAAGAQDDATLLLDVLYGIAAAPDGAARRRFGTASVVLRFMHGLSEPAGWRAQEAWAMVARCCAVAGAQQGGAVPPLSRASELALAAVVDGLVPAAGDRVEVEPVEPDRFVAAALSGDPHRLAGALHGLGRATVERIGGGQIEGLGVVETLALAVWLERLPHPAGRISGAGGIAGAVL